MCCGLLLEKREQISWTEFSPSTVKTIILVIVSCLLYPLLCVHACVPFQLFLRQGLSLSSVLLDCIQEFLAASATAFSLTGGMLGVRLHTLVGTSQFFKYHGLNSAGQDCMVCGLAGQSILF